MSGLNTEQVVEKHFKNDIKINFNNNLIVIALCFFGGGYEYFSALSITI